jgi:hypothetical protein
LLKEESNDPAFKESLKRKQIDLEHTRMLILEKKAKIVKMVLDKVKDCSTDSTTKEYNFRVGKFCDMVTSLSVYPHNYSSNTDVDITKK